MHKFSSNFSKITEEEGTLLNSFIALIPKADKDTIRKGNYRQILFMNIEAKTLNKMLTSSIQQRSRRILHNVKVGLIPEM